MSQPVIRVENLSKLYRLGRREERASTLLGAMGRFLAAPLQNYRRLRRLTHFEDAAKADDILWALRDVSFDVAAGEIVGVIGRNGAGKSTLLKILSRIMPPTRGRAEIHGRLASLLEVGTGFHPELSGRDNVFLNGAILGMTRREIASKFDEIVAFAEIEKFIDTPVKRYSSGMYVRLAFAVAAHLEPEILVVDEVLAVGDAAFQLKCLGMMQSVSSREGRTVLFVSHSMQAITTLCTRALIFEAGRLAASGTAQDMAARYLQMVETSQEQTLWRGDSGDDTFRLKLARVLSGSDNLFTTDAPLRVQIVAEVLQPLLGLICAVEIYSGHRQLLAYSAHDDALPPPPVTIPPGPFAWELTIPGDMLAAGSYELRLDFGIHNGRRLVEERFAFTISLENTKGVGRRFQSGWTHCFRPNWPWRKLNAAETVQIFQEVLVPKASPKK
jgi:lipopolysaccharide transport system ATP-binding protein